MGSVEGREGYDPEKSFFLDPVSGDIGLNKESTAIVTFLSDTQNEFKWFNRNGENAPISLNHTDKATLQLARWDENGQEERWQISRSDPDNPTADTDRSSENSTTLFPTETNLRVPYLFEYTDENNPLIPTVASFKHAYDLCHTSTTLKQYARIAEAIGKLPCGRFPKKPDDALVASDSEQKRITGQVPGRVVPDGVPRVGPHVQIDTFPGLATNSWYSGLLVHPLDTDTGVLGEPMPICTRNYVFRMYRDGFDVGYPKPFVEARAISRMALKNIEVTAWDKLDRTLYPNYTVRYEEDETLWIEWPDFRLRITYDMDNLEIQRMRDDDVTRLRIELMDDDRDANTTDAIKNAYVKLFDLVYAKQEIADQTAFNGILITMNSYGSYELATSYSSSATYYRIVDSVADKYPALAGRQLDRADVTKAPQQATFTHQGREWTLQGSGGAVYHPGTSEAVVCGPTVTLGRVVPPKPIVVVVPSLQSWDTPWGSFDNGTFDKKNQAFFDTFKDNQMYDSYYDSKKLAKFANLVCFQNTPSGGRETLRSQILQCCSRMVHDPIWGGRLPMETGVFQTHRYNDLHYHYGYIVYAAAIFLNDGADAEVKAAVDPLLYTMLYQCPPDKRSDPDWWMHDKRHMVPRYMSLVHGHSWAHGLMPMATGAQQESTSEAVNAWYAVYLYGTATEDVDLRDIGDRWTSTEMEGTKYWTDVTTNDWIPESTKDLDNFRFKPGDESWWPKGRGDVTLPPIVAIRGSLSLQKATWFGEYAWNRHMVQMLPVTPITRQLLSNDDGSLRFEQVYTKINDVAFPTYTDYRLKDGEGNRHKWSGNLVRTASLMRIMVKDSLLLDKYKWQTDGDHINLYIADKYINRAVPGDYYFNTEQSGEKTVYASLDDGLSYSVAKWFTRHQNQ